MKDSSHRTVDENVINQLLGLSEQTIETSDAVTHHPGQGSLPGEDPEQVCIRVAHTISPKS